MRRVMLSADFVCFAFASCDAEPSEGHAIDHIGWRFSGPLAKTIDGLRAKGMIMLTEPRPLPLPNGPTINFAYVAGPAARKSSSWNVPDSSPASKAPSYVQQKAYSHKPGE